MTEPLAKWLGTSVATVAAFFAIFGGTLVEIAPPDMAGLGINTKFAVGTASFVVLIVLALFRAVASSFGSSARPHWWMFLGAAGAIVFVISSLGYQERLSLHTFDHTLRNSDTVIRLIAGTELTPAAAEFAGANPDSRPEVMMLAGQTDDPTLVWTRASLITTQTSLTRWYQVVVCSACVAIFALFQAAVRNADKDRTNKP